MSEAGFWSLVRRKLAPYGNLERVENRTRKGTGDVNYTLLGVEGWVELKFRERWPVRSDTKVSFNHYTHEQVLWAEIRHVKGSRVGLLTQVGRDYFFFHPLAMRRVFDGLRTSDFVDNASALGRGAFPTTAILKQLIRTIP